MAFELGRRLDAYGQKIKTGLRLKFEYFRQRRQEADQNKKIELEHIRRINLQIEHNKQDFLQLKNQPAPP